MRSMLARSVTSVVLAALSVFWCTVLLAPPPAGALGARLYKSGPIQISADGATVWAVNPDNDSVTRIDTATETVLEIPLPGPGLRHAPYGLAVTDHGAEVWVACRDSDRLYVLRGHDGAVLDRIDLPWGTGPYSVVLAPPTGTPPVQTRGLVTGFRAGTVLVLDLASRTVAQTIGPLFKSPFAATFGDDGTAWVTHLFADGEHPRLTRIDFTSGQPRASHMFRVGATHPQSSSATAPWPAEGGYVTLRGHPAQVPAGRDHNRLWLPTTTQNLHDDAPSPDSTVQSAIRKLDIATGTLSHGSNTASNTAHPARVILSAVAVHDPQSGNRDGDGWNAGVSGPIDLAFSADGTTAWVLHENSEDLVVVPTATPPIKPVAAAPLVEIPVGHRPMGVVASPTSDLAYVANVLSRSITVVDLATSTPVRTVAATPVTGEPFAPEVLTGARLFHTSNRDAVSRNRKVACASCHLNGETDGRVWDLQHLPGTHGPRDTTSMLGLADTFGPLDPSTGWGQLHRSGDRDEVQDFEHTFQGPQMGGTGLLGATVHPELGSANAGRHVELDALASYLLTLAPVPRSPARTPGGGLTSAAERGATFFVGNDPSKAADAGCASCHDPSRGWVDLRFHDVGQAVRPGENELPGRIPPNHVNTPTLVGLWQTAPFGGIVSWTETLAGALLDFRDRPGARAPHGALGGLTGRQMQDLFAFLSSIDGDLDGATVRAARDQTPPGIVRVAPTSRTRIEVWLDESVDRASAEQLATWRLTDLVTGLDLPIVGAVLDPTNRDRVTLTTSTLPGGCPPRDFALRIAGPLFDLADSATGGVANARIDGPATVFQLGESLTITLGDSGQENLTVPVHDTATIPGLSNWSHGSAWLFDNGSPNTGLVRFEWTEAFRVATGAMSGDAITGATLVLRGDLGAAQTIEARRVLQAWYDHRGPDFNSNPIDPSSGRGGPTWNDVEHGARPWNAPNASASTPGVDGDDPSDYGGAHDVAATADAIVAMPAIVGPTRIAGARVTEAFRFWLDHPTLDHGYALRVLPGAVRDVRFQAHEHDFGHEGPVLEITYRVPGTCNTLFTDGFESGDTLAWGATVP